MEFILFSMSTAAVYNGIMMWQKPQETVYTRFNLFCILVEHHWDGAGRCRWCRADDGGCNKWFWLCLGRVSWLLWWKCVGSGWEIDRLDTAHHRLKTMKTFSLIWALMELFSSKTHVRHDPRRAWIGGGSGCSRVLEQAAWRVRLKNNSYNFYWQ